MKKSIKNAFAICLGAVVIGLTTNCQPTTKDNFTKATDPGFSYMGRTVVDGDSAVRFNYPGTTIKTLFNGTKVEVYMRPGSGSFIVTLDENEPVRWEFNDTTDCLSFDSLKYGDHTISIMLTTEGYAHNPIFYGIKTDGNNKLERPVLPDTKLLFIGNSITCGYGVEDTLPSHPFSYLTENHYKSYAAITARTLGAQWHSISRSGIGIYKNYGDVIEGSKICMRQQFHRTLFDNEEYMWDHSQYQPDVILFNLGTNDTSLDTYNKDLLQGAYDEFVDTLRQLYPSSKIVLLTGSMLSGKALEDVTECLDKTCKACNDKGDENVYRFDMSPQTGDLGFGADWHPSEKQQQKMANELISYLNENILTSKN